MVQPASAAPPKDEVNRITKISAFVLGALVLMAFLATVFQLFIRYEYVADYHGRVWRIDRITSERCLMTPAGARCGPLSSSKSTSISPSISTSVSGSRVR